MSDVALSMLSVLCRALNYNVDVFKMLVEFSPNEIRHYVASREGLSSSECKTVLDRIKHLHSSLKAYEIVHPLHKSYPQRFSAISQPPVFLCTYGDLGFLSEAMLTVIGSRRTLPAFTDWMDVHFTGFLKNNSVVTVSGGAYGIDAYATRLALFCNRPSVLILPSGLERGYPDHVKRWQSHKNILSMTEYFPEETVRNYHFVNRNRLLGSISPFVFAVQCAIKSGTMTTVRSALDCGGEVFVLPSFPGSIESGGNIQLLQEGAQLICREADLELGMGMLSPHKNGKQQEQSIGNP